MISRIAFFENAENLMQLTGIRSKEELEQKGFYPENIVFGFCCLEEITTASEYYYTWMIDRFKESGNAYYHVDLNGIHFYIMYDIPIYPSKYKTR